MKTFKLLLLILLACQIFEINAQSADTVVLTKKNREIFIAEIKTYSEVKEGILYKADSSEITILNSLYQRVTIPISEIKTLKIKNFIAGIRGFKAGSYPFFIITTLYVGIPIISSGLPTAGSLAAAGLASIITLGIGTGLVIGGILAILSKRIPAFYIDVVKYPKKYHNQLRYIKLKTQEVLIKRHPKRIKKICLNCMT